MNRQLVILMAAVMVLSSAFVLVSSAASDAADTSPTVTVGDEQLTVTQVNEGAEYYLIDITADDNSNYTEYPKDTTKDTFVNYEILTNANYSGKDVVINIPEGTTLYLLNVASNGHYGVDFCDSLNSIRITGSGILDVASQPSATIHQRYIGFNGVDTTIDGIEITDIVMLYGGSIARETGTLSSTNLTIDSMRATDYEAQEDKGTFIVAGSRFADVQVTNLTINSITVEDDVNVSVFGGCLNSFQTRDSCGSVGTSNVTVNGGDYSYIMGGSYQGGYSDGYDVDKSSTCGTTNVTLGSGVTVDNVYGGGYRDVSTGTTNINIDGANVEYNVYGGGWLSGAESTNVKITDGQASFVYGGSRTSGEVGDTSILMSGGTVSSIAGGNYRASTDEHDSSGDTSITITGGSITGSVFGGGTYSGCGDISMNISGDVEFSKDSCIYGGSRLSGDVSDITITVKDVPWVHTIYGGALGYKETPGGHSGSVSITVDNSNVRQTYGGGYYSATDVSETVYLAGSTVQNHVFGGGYGAAVQSSHIVINDGVSVAHSVYGGGHYDSTESVTIDILGGDIGRGVLAGGRDDNSSNPENFGLSSVGDAVINVYGGNIGQTGDKDRGVFAGGGSDDENGKVTGNVSINIRGGNVYAVTLSDANVTNPTTSPQTPEVEISGGTFNTSIKNEWLADGLSVSYDSEGNVVIGESRPPIIWDDDDDYVPPIVPAQPEDSGNDTTTIVACAAAAVVAALMAAFLILDRRH